MQPTKTPAVMAPLESTQLGEPVTQTGPLAFPDSLERADRSRMVRRPGSALVSAVCAARFPTIDPPRLAFRFVILIARHLQLDVAMIAAGGIG